MDILEVLQYVVSKRCLSDDGFLPRPNAHSMLDLIEEANRQGARDEELAVIVDFAKDTKQNQWETKPLYAIALLASGKLDVTLNSVQKTKSIGWSNNSTGLVFAAVLVSLTADVKEVATVNRLLTHYADEFRVYFTYDIESDTSELYRDVQFSEEIKKGLRRNPPSESSQKKYLTWAETIGQEGIEHIVSNKHINAYERAAKVLGALMEVFAVKGDKAKAKALFTSFYHEKLNRHSAFRNEVKTVISQSPVLKNLNLQSTKTRSGR